MTVRRSLIETRLGRKNAERLALAFGGTRLNVPGDPRNGDRLKRALGDELALLVIFHFGSSRFYVPTLARAVQVDPRKLKRLARRGWSSARIARELGCSERTVDKYRALLRQRAIRV